MKKRRIVTAMSIGVFMAFGLFLTINSFSDQKTKKPILDECLNAKKTNIHECIVKIQKEVAVSHSKPQVQSPETESLSPARDK